jgi:hypothetical protein
MQSTLPLQLLPRIDLVYGKTAAGRAELTQRSAGLTARQRAALIMLDGQRDATALHAVMPAEQVAPVLAALIALRLIAPPAVAPASPSLDAIKAELIDAAETYLGVMASDVILRVRQAADARTLLRMLGHWHMAMQDSKHGKLAAASLLEKTKAALR